MIKNGIDSNIIAELIETEKIIIDEFGRDFAIDIDVIELMLITINRLASRGEMNG